MMRPLTILLFAATAAPCLAGVKMESKDAATLEIRFDAANPKLALSDLITVTLTVKGSTALDVYGAPLDLPTPAPWLLVQRSKPQLETDDGRQTWRMTYRFAPRAPGKAVVFAFPEVKYRDRADHSASWTPVAFEVETQIATPDRTTVHDITAIEEVPAVAPVDDAWLRWIFLVGVGLLIGGAAIALYFVLRKRPIRTPVELALHEWHRLIAMKLPEQGRSERFITLLTTLLRRYLERQYALPARRRTTPEFRQQLEACALLTIEQKQFLTTFLQRCDAVKFAHQTMTPDECRQCADEVRQFLQAR